MAMPELDQLLVPDPAALRAWLAEHHQTSPGVRLVLGKAGGSVTTMTWATAVEVLLCVGWIDGQAGQAGRRQLDDPSHPASSEGMWSARNVGLVEKLEAEGRMRPAGRAQVEAAKADGRWDRAYAGPATTETPDDLAAAIAADPAAQAMWDVLTKTNRFSLIHRVTTVKRAETRARKITEAVAMLARGETPHPQKARPAGTDERE